MDQSFTYMVKIIGSGRFGTALSKIMPDAELISARRDDIALTKDDLVFWAIPTQCFLEVYERISPRSNYCNIICSKGLLSCGRHPTEFLDDRYLALCIPDRYNLFMAGPSITSAQIPWGSILFSEKIPLIERHPELQEFARISLPTRTLNRKALVTAAVLKNIAAFLCGYMEAALGSNYVSLIVAEFVALFQELGLPKETLPDLLLTCYHCDSNNHRAGRYVGLLGREPSLDSSELACETIFSFSGIGLRWPGELATTLKKILGGEPIPVSQLLKAIGLKNNSTLCIR